MTDSKLRELERRWKETGSVEDEAAYLLERVRAGDLEQEKLELAAYCGHQGARSALGSLPAMVFARELEAVLTWAGALEHWGRPAMVCAALAAARIGLDSCAEAVSLLPPDCDQVAPERSLNAAEAWLACPCDAHARDALRAAQDAVDAWEGTDLDLCALACSEAGWQVSPMRQPGYLPHFLNAIRCAGELSRDIEALHRGIAKGMSRWALWSIASS